MQLLDLPVALTVLCCAALDDEDDLLNLASTSSQLLFIIKSNWRHVRPSSWSVSRFVRSLPDHFKGVHDQHLADVASHRYPDIHADGESIVTTHAVEPPGSAPHTMRVFIDRLPEHVITSLSVCGVPERLHLEIGGAIVFECSSAAAFKILCNAGSSNTVEFMQFMQFLPFTSYHAVYVSIRTSAPIQLKWIQRPSALHLHTSRFVYPIHVLDMRTHHFQASTSVQKCQLYFNHPTENLFVDAGIHNSSIKSFTLCLNNTEYGPLGVHGARHRLACGHLFYKIPIAHKVNFSSVYLCHLTVTLKAPSIESFQMHIGSLHTNMLCVMGGMMGVRFSQ